MWARVAFSKTGNWQGEYLHWKCPGAPVFKVKSIVIAWSLTKVCDQHESDKTSYFYQPRGFSRRRTYVLRQEHGLFASLNVIRTKQHWCFFLSQSKIYSFLITTFTTRLSSFINFWKSIYAAMNRMWRIRLTVIVCVSGTSVLKSKTLVSLFLACIKPSFIVRVLCPISFFYDVKNDKAVTYRSLLALGGW